MRRSQTVQHYARLAVSLKTHSDLHQMMEEATPRLGFNYYSVTHYVPDLLAANLVALSSFPERWTAFARERDFAAYSPIRQMCRRSIAGFTWSQLESLKLTKRQSDILRAGRRHGVGDGFTIPANVPEDVSGLVSYAMAGDEPLPATFLHAAQYIGCFVYEAALRISKIGRSRTGLRARCRRASCSVSCWWRAGRAIGKSANSSKSAKKRPTSTFRMRCADSMLQHAPN